MSRTEPGRRPLRSLLRAQDGFTLIEVLASMLVLTVGIVGLLSGFTVSQKLSLSSERESSMAHVAQREIERIEGLSYASIALNATPSPSTDPTSPDYYVSAGSTPSYEWNQTQASAEPLDVDTSNGTVSPVQSWTEGGLSGSIYDFVTSSTDSRCDPGCPSSGDYKRVTVAVTVSGTGAPSPVYVSSVITNPNAAPAEGTANGTAGNPVTDGSTLCANADGTQGPCESPIDSGVPNTFFLHDCPATNSSCSAPTGSSVLHDTVGLVTNGVSGLACQTGLTSLTSLTSSVLGSDTGGCPTPDEMDPSPPAGDSSTPLYQYSTDLGTTGYPGGRLLQPLCGSGGCGTGNPSDCNSAASWTSSLVNAQNEMWATAPLSADTTLTGEGAMNLFTQTQNGTAATVTLCVELYDIPPSGGTAGSLADLLSWPPKPLGGAVGYVAATDPVTGSNWPTSATNVEYEFNFASSGATVPAGDRIGLRVWMVANVDNAIALLYDNPTYPSEIQLNSQSAIQLSAS